MKKYTMSMFASKQYTASDLKKLFDFNNTLTIDLVRGRTGAVRVFTDGKPTVIVARGGGYDKAGAALGDLLNNLFGTDINGAEGIKAVISKAKKVGVDIIPVDEKEAKKPKNVIDSYVIKKSSGASSHALTDKEKEVLVNNFREINDFYEKNNREPEETKENIYEYKLGTRLKHLRNSPEHIKYIKEAGADKYNLLDNPGASSHSTDTIESVCRQFGGKNRRVSYKLVSKSGKTVQTQECILCEFFTEYVKGFDSYEFDEQADGVIRVFRNGSEMYIHTYPCKG